MSNITFFMPIFLQFLGFLPPLSLVPCHSCFASLWAFIHAFSNATLIHRSQDGGVILQTKTPTYAASVVRQSKKYFRYQSGKSMQFSTGVLFKPVYEVTNAYVSYDDGYNNALPQPSQLDLNGKTPLKYSDNPPR
jgi:hypothetical protein